MIWKRIIKRFILSLTPIIIIPAFLVFLILWTFGLSLTSFLLIFTLAQLYLIWFHVEVALRQTKLTELSYEPVFIAEVREDIGGRRTPEGTPCVNYYIRIKNIGNYPAYNLIVNLDPMIREVIPEIQLNSIIGSLGKDQEETLCIIPLEGIRKLQNLGIPLKINIDYTNILNSSSSVSFAFHPQFISFPITFHGQRKLPGLLLNSIDELNLLVKLIMLPRKLSKLKKYINMETNMKNQRINV
jgi:hypothetical protein